MRASEKVRFWWGILRLGILEPLLLAARVGVLLSAVALQSAFVARLLSQAILDRADGLRQILGESPQLLTLALWILVTFAHLGLLRPLFKRDAPLRSQA